MNQYILIKDYVSSRDRNYYPARNEPYNEGEIPQEAIDQGLAVLVEPNKFETPKAIESAVVSETIRAVGPVEDSLDRTVIKPTITTPPQILDDRSNYTSINTASIDELIDVDGIGEKLAERAIKFRPYVSLEEADIKCPIGFGRKWKDLKVRV